MRFKLLIILFFLAPLLLAAQEYREKEHFNSSPILKFSYLSLLLDPLPSIQFALEYQVAKRQSLQHELGYITPLLHETSYNNSIGKGFKGVRIRNEYRYYLNPDKSGFGGFYFAPEILLIFMNYQKEGTFGQDCDGSFDCAYYQRKDFTVRKQVYAIHPKIGYQWIFGRFAMDIYGGFGYRKVIIQQSEEPGQRRWWDDDGYNFFEKGVGRYDLPSMSFGMKVGFLLKKRELEELPYYKENY